ncbi:MAG: hypothetical protein ABSC94_21330 [Polyangiaceae bacterium]
MIALLARLALARLLRQWGWCVACGAWCVLAVGVAVVTHVHGTAHGADEALLGAFATLALPLLTYSVVGGVLGARSLAASIAPFVGIGAPPARAAGVVVVVCASACVVFGASIAAAVALLAHGAADPSLARDGVTSAYAGALGGAAYAGWFSLGATFGRRGGGRTALLLADWVLGSSGGAAALATPRGYVRTLLGGVPPMDLSGRMSSLVLLGLAVACAIVAVRRAAAGRA